MAQIVIPKNWRTAVSAILSTDDTRYIQWTENARQRYEADFYPLWPYEVYRPIQDYLIANNPTGCPVVMKRPAGETYEFFFTLRSSKAYGKVLLRTDIRTIVLFSATPTSETETFVRVNDKSKPNYERGAKRF
jgi:hypothetical protein